MTTRAAERKSRPTTQLSRDKQQAESPTVVVQQESAELREQVAALRQEIERLKAEREASPPTSGPAASGGTVQGRRVALQAGEAVDVDNRRRYRVESSGVEVSRVTDSDYLMNPRGYEFFPLTTDLNETNCKGAGATMPTAGMRSTSMS